MIRCAAVVSVALCGGVCCAAVAAQEVGNSEESGPRKEVQEAQAEPKEQATRAPVALPPEIAIGVRVELVRRGLPVVPIVVVVPDVRSYVAAISGWTLTARYPVLIDDRSSRAAEDIGRFVRAFEPDQVVRWRAEDDGEAFNVDARCMEAVCNAWGVSGESGLEALKAQWAAIGFAPPGVVVANENDEAWVAGLALAAGRGQPIVWVNGLPTGVNRASTKPVIEAAIETIEAGCEATGYPWRGLGDVIETVTICANMPVRYALQAKDEVAVTDRVGRIGDGKNGETGRWGWSGQIFGNAQQASYRAMCSLYLSVGKAWLFDGYGMDGAWGEYDLTRAADVLRESGLETAVLDTPSQGEREWRTAASRSLNADLILINSSGNRNWFNLKPGRCSPGDLPILNRPVVMHMVHSWSAVTPGRPATVAGRWFERGAYAYAGSVQEPYLSAFEPGEVIAQRLLAPAPFGVAIRRKGMHLWKVACLGDPLLTLGPPAQRVEGEVPLEGSEALTEQLARLLKQNRYGDAVEVLVMLGRDEDAVRLAAAVGRDEPGAFDEGLAAAVVFPSFRAGDVDVLVDAFGRLSNKEAGKDLRRDALWNALWPRLTGLIEADLIGLLERNVREDNVARDAAALAPAMRRAFGSDRARMMLMDAKKRAPNKQSQKILNDALSGRK